MNRKLILRGENNVKTAEIVKRLRGITNYVSDWLEEEGINNIEEDMSEEKCLTKDLRNLIFEIKYKD